MSRLDEAREHLSERHKKFPPMPLGSMPVVRIPVEWVDKESEHVRLLLRSEALYRAASDARRLWSETMLPEDEETDSKAIEAVEAFEREMGGGRG